MRIIVRFMSLKIINWKYVQQHSPYTLNPLSANSQNGQTQLNNSSAKANKLFECILSFCVVGA